MYYQIHHSQGKLIQVVKGKIFDIAVNLRKESNTFGQSIQIELDEKDRKKIWIPSGFAHGFIVVSQSADILYKTTDYYFPEYEISIFYMDPLINIK